jgi:hypothetical protein
MRKVRRKHRLRRVTKTRIENSEKGEKRMEKVNRV